MKMRRKAISLIAIIAVLVALGFWTSSRWDVWFSNPEEPAYIASNEPSRILLTFGDSTATSRNISWMCDSVVMPSYIELYDTTAHKLAQSIPAIGEVYESRSGKAAYYHGKLRDLLYGHTYKYRVATGDAVSEWHTFTMQQEGAPASFIYVGDVQDSIDGVANSLLKNAFKNNPDAEFLICGGDLTERPIDKYWAESFRTLDSIGQSMPVLTITGNHDYLKGIIGNLERRFSLIHSYFLDSMIGENQVFTTHYSDIQFFLLDSNREFPYLFTQREWLEKELIASKAKWKIVIAHHPLYSIRGSMNNLVQRWMFDDLVRKYGVDLILQGHEHAYARMTTEGSTPVYTVSHCSPKSYRIEFDDIFDKFGSGSRYYQKVHASNDTLYITAYDANNGTLYDSLLIVNNGNMKNIIDCGKNIREVVEFEPAPGSKKDAEFAERIKEYKEKHKDRF